MAIDLSSYYTYLNSMTSGLTQNIGRTGAYSTDYRSLGLSDEGTEESSFDLSFMAMLAQSKEAFEKIEEVNGLEEEPSGTKESLYGGLSSLLSIYNSMNQTSLVPGSIKESLLTMLNQTETSSQDDTFSDYQSELNISSIIQKAVKSV